MEIILEKDPTPIVKIFANKLSHASHHASFTNIASKIVGSFALASNKDPQSLTITISGNKLSLRHGIQKDAKIIIRMDFDDPKKVKVEGLIKHPLMAMNVAKLLEFSTPRWGDAAKQFWEKNHDYPNMPNGITINCTNEQRQLTIGEEPADVALFGDSSVLAEIFSGNKVFVQAIMSGKLHAEASFEHAVVLSDVTLQMLLGDR